MNTRQRGEEKGLRQRGRKEKSNCSQSKFKDRPGGEKATSIEPRERLCALDEGKWGPNSKGGESTNERNQYLARGALEKKEGVI